MGGLGSVALAIYAGIRVGSPPVVMALFAGWVLFPFLALAWGRALSHRWESSTRASLAVVTAILAIVSVASYAYVALGAAKPTAPVFVLLPPVSLVLAALIVGAAGLFSRR